MAPPDLSNPRATSGTALYEQDALGRLAERLARFLGTGRYLVVQTVIVIVWITLNVAAAATGVWDAYPFKLLNLVFSTQAAYAAPLILLAQNRQADREQTDIQRDRETRARFTAETDFVAREIAALHLAVQQKADQIDLVSPLNRLAEELERLQNGRGRDA